MFSIFCSKVSFEMLNAHCFVWLLSDYLSFRNTQAELRASLLALKRGTIFFCRGSRRSLYSVFADVSFPGLPAKFRFRIQFVFNIGKNSSQTHNEYNRRLQPKIPHKIDATISRKIPI